MKNLLRLPVVMLVFAGLIPLLNSCFKEETVPVVTTIKVENVSQCDAFVAGNVASDGGKEIIARGICWGTDQYPTIENSKIIEGSGIGDFTAHLKGLVPGKDYFARAFASNSIGTGYGNEVPFTTQMLTDIDGNTYSAVAIGGQIWMADNLKTTKLNDGTEIPLIPANTEWLVTTTPGYCWYNGDENAYGETYGALYNWYTVATGKLCPEGWHIPSDAEWVAMVDNIGGIYKAGGKLKEIGTIHWNSPNTGATDEFDFTGLPGGYKSPDGIYEYIGEYGNYLTSSDSSSTHAWRWYLSFEHERIFKNASHKNYAFSARCVKN